MFGELEEDLQDLAPSWLPGHRPPSVDRGNLGLGLQAQEILANLHDSIIPIREPLAILLGRRPHTQATTLVAILSGLDRNTTGGLLRRLAATPEARHDPRSSAGRKRARSELLDLAPIAEDVLVLPAPSKAIDLPDLSCPMSDWLSSGTNALVFGDISFDYVEAVEASQSELGREPSFVDESLKEASIAAVWSSERQNARHSLAHVLLAPCVRDNLYEHWAAAAAVSSPYQGLGSLSLAERELAVGLRLCGFAAKLFTDGTGFDDFARWMHVLDAHLLGELGQINHPAILGAP